MMNLFLKLASFYAYMVLDLYSDFCREQKAKYSFIRRSYCHVITNWIVSEDNSSSYRMLAEIRFR